MARRKASPPFVVLFGLALGFCGVALLIGTDALSGTGGSLIRRVSGDSGVVLLVFWLSLYARGTHLTSPAVLVTGMQMMGGGLCLLVVSGLLGEFGRVNLAAVSTQSLLSLLYLIVFGAVVGHSAYFWLLKNSNPGLVATYLCLCQPGGGRVPGLGLHGEALSPRLLLASVIIITAVALITLYTARRSGQPTPRG